ncbi:MAG: hypothetical protein AAF318_14995 [Pseudomonadota bacterium]
MKTVFVSLLAAFLGGAPALAQGCAGVLDALNAAIQDTHRTAIEATGLMDRAAIDALMDGPLCALAADGPDTWRTVATGGDPADFSVILAATLLSATGVDADAPSHAPPPWRRALLTGPADDQQLRDALLYGCLSDLSRGGGAAAANARMDEIRAVFLPASAAAAEFLAIASARGVGVAREAFAPDWDLLPVLSPQLARFADRLETCNPDE